jgi:hypothetical protein
MTNFLDKDVSADTNKILSLVALIIFFPILLLATYQVAQLVSKASGTRVIDTPEKSIIVDTGNTLEPITTDFYHAFAQGGEESKDMLAPVVKDVAALHPKLIRLDHIFDLYGVVSGSGGSLTFNFSKLDEAVNTILATGAKPLFSLSFMPQSIAQNGVVINPPNNWDDWATVVARTIEHYSGKQGKNMNGIYYEVWNEPDLAQFGKWTIGNYLTLYRYAAQGAARAQNVNQFFLGGPATTGLYKSWILALTASGNRLDFLSWHSYLPDPTRFADDQKNITAWLLADTSRPSLALLPKLITEFGFNGDKDVRYSNNYAAAYTAAVIRQLIPNKPTYAFSFEFKDGPNQQSGNGWGLISHESNGLKYKPRYYIYSFLDAMAGTRLALTGEGTWITGFSSIRDGVVRILLVNFDREGTHTESFPVTVKNLPEGNYTFRQRLLSGKELSYPESVSKFAPFIRRNVALLPQTVVIVEISKQK